MTPPTLTQEVTLYTAKAEIGDSRFQISFEYTLPGRADRINGEIRGLRLLSEAGLECRSLYLESMVTA